MASYPAELKNIIHMLFPDASSFDRALESMAGFAAREIAPTARKTDEESSFPRHNLTRVSEQGIFSMPFPEEFGGRGLPFPVYVAAIEILAWACANTALQVSIQGMVSEGIRRFCSEAQRQHYLTADGIASGRRLVAFALTEPCCGSDAGAIQTMATADGDTYVLNGSKTLITNAGEADHVLVFARAPLGISAFIVPSRARGLTVMKVIPKLGFRGNQLASLRLQDCVVDKGTLFGEEGKGLEYAKHMLNVGRITISAIGLGIACAAYEKAIGHSKGRRAFNSSVADFQLTQEKIAEMATGISAARLLTYYAAHRFHLGRDIAAEASHAKLFTSETALRVCDHAIQIHGGYGYTDAADIHRHWRDARLLPIGEGTSEMLKLLAAHLALKEA